MKSLKEIWNILFQAHNKQQLMNNDLNASVSDAINLYNDRKCKEVRELLKLLIQDNPHRLLRYSL